MTRVRRPDMSDAAEVIRKARLRLDDSVHGAAPAPYRALDLIEGACSGWTLEEGMRAEEEAFAELLSGPQAQASVYAFGLVELRSKKPAGLPDAEPRKLGKIGVVGAGLMATQLATLILRRLEVPVAIRDVDQARVDEALETIRGELAGLEARGRYPEGKGRFLGELVHGTTGYDGFEDCDLVLEAVFEELSVKKEVFAELEAVVRDDCVLATNTSSLSVTEMGADLRPPGAARRHPLLQSRRADAARRADPHARGRRRHAGDGRTCSRRSCASGRSSSPTRPASSSTACSRG